MTECTYRLQTSSFRLSSRLALAILLFLAVPRPLALHAAALPASFPVAEQLLTGIDRLDVSHCTELSGLKVGLITNHAAQTRRGEPGYAMMLRNKVRLQYLMSPEHGFAGDVEAGRKALGGILEGDLPVHSLYGAARSPDPALLQQIDLLVFDLQDVGVRCYTYLSTMKNAMQACSETGTAFMVLDRPNPIAPLGRGGFMLQPRQASFVGAENIPFIHAMTLGELAQLIKARHFPALKLRVIPMQGWSRSRFGDDYPGFTFRSPSPNISSVETAMVYPATVFLEATAISEGRGTDAPFMQFGAPFIESGPLVASLNQRNLPGVRFSPVSFMPTTSKFKGKRCRGVRISLTSRSEFNPFLTGVAILQTLQRHYPSEIGIEQHKAFFDRLAGTSRLREMIIGGEPLPRIMEECRLERESFQPSLLYR
ncbi:MAG: DUF1343 domain-containing protein [Chlorobium sp.]|nr:DUF1343 domain-containing protein [Chlorobium phaeovibrioides]NQU45663.1 DUF1343 domain-containing protein [Chlorobium sp.]